jgi:hypothetical protein
MDADDNENIKLLTWNSSLEQLLSQWGDACNCYRLLHERGHRKFRKINTRYALPITIVSTVSAMLSFTDVFPISPEYNKVMIGCINMCVGIISTLNQYFKYAQRSEAHLNVSVQWHRVYRMICNELNMERRVRRPAYMMVKLILSDFERLMEMSPLLPEDVITWFKKEHGTIKGLHVPEDIGKLEHLNSLIKATTPSNSEHGGEVEPVEIQIIN